MTAPLSTARIAAAILADLIQLPLIAAFDTAILAVPSEAAILLVDVAACILTTALMRFHWLLLPSLAIEAIPDIDALPTWTGCVAFVVWRRRFNQSGAEGEQKLMPLAESDSENISDAIQ